jgi:hypothetical protein
MPLVRFTWVMLVFPVLAPSLVAQQTPSKDVNGDALCHALSRHRPG